MRLHPLSFLDKLPPKENDGEEEHHHVATSVVSEGSIDFKMKYSREQEVGNIPEARQKYSVATNKCHDECADECIVRCVWLQDTNVRQSPPVQTLHPAGLVETQERVTHDREVDELGCGDQADKPAKNDRRVLTELQE